MYIYFIPDKDVEKIVEKYIRKGPSPRYKVKVVPIKILTKCKGGKLCYRTYYVGNRKFERYRNIAKQQLKKRTKLPTYITYWNEAVARFRQFKIGGWQSKYLGNTFTKDLVHLSGFAWAHTNRLARIGVSSYSEVVSSSFNEREGKHYVKFKDGSIYQTQMLLDKNGNINLKTIGTIPTLQGKYQFEAEIGGKISLVKDEDGIIRRTLFLTTIKGYNSEALSGFMEFMQHKFARIGASIKNMSMRDVGKLLLNGFGENVKVDNSIKREILTELEKLNLNLPDKVKRWISTSINLQDITNALVRSGIINENHPLIKRLAHYAKKKSDGVLVFNSVKGNVHNTKSQNTLHAFQLQLSADNDYHKGFRRYNIKNSTI